MNKNPKAKPAKAPKTTPEFEKAIKTLVNTPPISNVEITKRSKSKSS